MRGSGQTSTRCCEKPCKPEKCNKQTPLKAVQHLVISPFAENTLSRLKQCRVCVVAECKHARVCVQRLLLASFGSERQRCVKALGAAGNRKRRIFGQISGLEVINGVLGFIDDEMQMSGFISSRHLGTGSLDAANVLQIAVALFKNRSMFSPIQLFLHSFVTR